MSAVTGHCQALPPEGGCVLEVLVLVPVTPAGVVLARGEAVQGQAVAVELSVEGRNCSQHMETDPLEQDVHCGLVLRVLRDVVGLPGVLGEVVECDPVVLGVPLPSGVVVPGTAQPRVAANTQLVVPDPQGRTEGATEDDVVRPVGGSGWQSVRCMWSGCVLAAPAA